MIHKQIQGRNYRYLWTMCTDTMHRYSFSILQIITLQAHKDTISQHMEFMFETGTDYNENVLDFFYNNKHQ